MHDIDANLLRYSVWRLSLRFVEWFNAPPADVHGLLRAGVAHAWFEPIHPIHPFEDGNGRVGRALLDRALALDKSRSVRLYSLSARFMAVRNEYYDVLCILESARYLQSALALSKIDFC